MTLDFIIHFVRSVMNNNAPLTLILLSSIVLVYTIIVSALRQEWARYAFLILLGGVLYFASTTINDNINKEFFSGLSTELFGAAIALVILGKWMLPSFWSLSILSIVVILGELLIFRIKNPSLRSYYLGMASNIWGAFLVAILLEELVHKREGREKDREDATKKEKEERKNRAMDKYVKKLEKEVEEASQQHQKQHVERLQKILESMQPSGWDVEITIHGRNRRHLQSQLLRIQQMVHVVHTSEIYKHPESDYCHCYIKASTVKPSHLNGNGKTNGTGKINTAWMAESADALKEEAQQNTQRS
ncbi:MAG: hypothetical protein GC179_08165 [Anaerolineaceae bacterium]|nr:hypothetical protein [Anaerolineaceae bacterium]